ARSGGVRLLVAGRRLATRVLRNACVVVVLAHERPDPEGCATLLPDVGEIWVPCAQRRTIVYGRLPRRASGAHLDLGSGATVAADVDRRTRAWIAAAPSVAALRAIVITGRGGSRFALALPPAAPPCAASS